MDDPYGLPTEFRNFAATSTGADHGLQLSSSSSPNPLPFPAEPFSVHRNLTSPFPLGGAGLVELGTHHHHHHHGHNIVHHDHDHDHHHHSISGSTSCALYGSSKISNIHHHDHDHHDQAMESSEGVWNNSSIGNIIDSSYNEANNTRWPRQETLTLLEIRSRLNSKFKETNQKAPLWDEVSRIMAEDHGYHRSGKKCKEKFENLYKYYKKTKEGKAGRQDGKHYRFFRQLEAIYGDQTSNQSSSLLLDTNNLGRNPLLHDHHMTSTSTPNLNMRTSTNSKRESLSFSINSTEFETSSSENNNEDDLSAIAFKMKFNHQAVIMDRDQKINTPSRKSSSWKLKVEGFVNEQMKKIMVTQETWMEKMLKSIIDKEEEGLAKEEERRKQETAKFNQEVSEFWAKEKAWVEARDAALMATLKKFRGKGIELPSFPERVIGNIDHIRTDMSCANYHRWSEEETSSLIELQNKYNLEETFQGGISEYVKDGIWEEIASKMACLGYERTSLECKEKWESISVHVRMTNECRKKRKEDYYKSSTAYFDDHDQLNLKQEHHERHYDHTGLQLMDERLSPSSSNVGTQMHPNSCFHLLFGEGENLWEKCGGLRLSKADKMNQQVHNK